MNIYFSTRLNRITDYTGHPIRFIPRLTFGEKETINLTLDIPVESFTWTLSGTTDSGTVILQTTSDQITTSGQTIIIPVDTFNESFASATEKNPVNASFEICGSDSSGSREHIITIPFIAEYSTACQPGELIPQLVKATAEAVPLPYTEPASVTIETNSDGTPRFVFGIPAGKPGDEESITVEEFDEFQESNTQILTEIQADITTIENDISGMEISTPEGTAFPLVHNTITKHTLSADETITFDTSAMTADKSVTMELWLTMPETVISFTVSGVTWIEDPAFDTGNMLYAVTVRWDGEKIIANLAYTMEVS